MDKPIFSLGEYVEVSYNRTYAGREDVPNGTGFIIGINQGGILYSVKFVGDRTNQIYRQVPVSCLKKQPSTQFLSRLQKNQYNRVFSVLQVIQRLIGINPIQPLHQRRRDLHYKSFWKKILIVGVCLPNHYINFLKKDTRKKRKRVGFE